MLIHDEGALHMTKYREILRLTALGLSLRDIEKSLKVSRKTVVKVQKRADELSLSWPLDESLTDAELEQRMFPKDLSPKSTKRMPDFDYIRKELLKNGVNKKLLWTHDKRMNDCLPPILFSAIFKLLKVLPDTELDAC